MIFISLLIVINFSTYCDLLKTNTIKPTKEINLQVDECYEISLGYYRNNSYNLSTIKKCPSTNKGCYAQTESTKTNLEVAGCNYNNHICGDSAFVVKYNYSLTYTCCESKLCNSQEFINNKLKYKCEFGKRLLKSMKLTYGVKNTKLKSVNKCYYCNECNSFKDAKIINCTTENKTNKKFACSHFYRVDTKTKSTIYNGDCISIEDMTLITYEKIKYKELSCQTDLCNSPSIAKISTGILCTDGYYT